MQRPPPDDVNSSFSSTDMDTDLARQEEQLVEKYGRLQLKQRMLTGGKKQDRRYFDSADWQMQKQGKLIPDMFLGYDCPVDQLPVKLEPTVPGQRQRTHLDAVAWAQPAILPVNSSRTVIDI
ncbi:hypothetical protein GPECTOR_12g502 [Gonium pectorale]|uniref:Uncharacterized protein n=1 Tax=Gonium pectorale TaxID=33097 RepID=A0A150GNX7_GONPE|nr:hypothetical protein GPECTOR_12g502 [Gonium pectorale]|eukprot:KXZ51539.1 hypothetical protein GPECTOR_12g502 [Gonium pectorale]